MSITENNELHINIGFFLFLDIGKKKIFILIRYGNKGIKRIGRMICNWSPDCTSSFSKVHASE